MWIARDKDGELRIYHFEPVRNSCYDFWTIYGARDNIDNKKYGETVDNELFPDLTWKNKPMEVEIWSKDYWKRTIDDIVHKYISKNDSGEYTCVNDIINSITDEICG